MIFLELNNVFLLNCIDFLEKLIGNFLKTLHSSDHQGNRDWEHKNNLAQPKEARQATVVHKQGINNNSNTRHRAERSARRLRSTTFKRH